jgi:formate dehydrogenase major subunit
MTQIMPSLEQHHLGEAGAGRGGHLSRWMRPTSPGNEIIFWAGFPDRERPRQDGARRSSSRPTRSRRPSTRWCSRPGRVLEHWHTGSMTRRSGVLDALGAGSGGLHAPARHGPHGLRPGDFVRLETRRGAVEVKAALRPRRAGHDGVHALLLRGGSRQPLTNPALDPFGKIPEYKFCAAGSARRRQGSTRRNKRSGWAGGWTPALV